MPGSGGWASESRGVRRRSKWHRTPKANSVHPTETQTKTQCGGSVRVRDRVRVARHNMEVNLTTEIEMNGM